MGWFNHQPDKNHLLMAYILKRFKVSTNCFFHCNPGFAWKFWLNELLHPKLALISKRFTYQSPTVFPQKDLAGEREDDGYRPMTPSTTSGGEGGVDGEEDPQTWVSIYEKLERGEKCTKGIVYTKKYGGIWKQLFSTGYFLHVTFQSMIRLVVFGYVQWSCDVPHFSKPVFRISSLFEFQLKISMFFFQGFSMYLN